jgi:polysaccharide export outer membrane protein
MQQLIGGAIYASVVGITALLVGCSGLPTSGPSASEVQKAGQTQEEKDTAQIQVVDVTDSVARRLREQHVAKDFLTVLGDDPAFQRQFGVGDTVDISIWEAPPATLFGGGSDALPGASVSQVTTLPDQVIDGDGMINVPFAGMLKATGRTPAQLQGDIVRRLSGMAHDPQVLVRLSKNATSYVTVVGDVTTSSRMPLSARGERLLDALAVAGGVRQPVDKETIQMTRGATVASLPLSVVIGDPRQNVPLRAGDVITALYQPYSFSVLGATGKNEEISFEAQGITLAQALGRAGGLDDSRSDAKGVFIFRFEKASSLSWPTSPVRTTADGRVPVVYRINLRDPAALFVAQDFMISDKDLIYVSNAPVAELQKFLNVIFTIAYPIVNSIDYFR